MKPIGILAGTGLMPLLGIEGARAEGRDVFVVDVGPEGNGHLPTEGAYRRIPIWEYGHVVQAFLDEGVRDVYLLGKLPPTLIMDTRLDDAARRIIGGLDKKSEHQVIAAFIDDMTRRGLRIRSQAELLAPLLVSADFSFAADTLTPEQRQDVRRGYDVACGLARYVDGGQTVVVKGGLVLALEAAEGTDATIRRGGRLGGPGAVVVKAKGQRDGDFDLPVVGMETFRAVVDAGAAVLAMEADNVFLLDRDAILEAAAEAGVALVTVGGGEGP